MNERVVTRKEIQYLVLKIRNHTNNWFRRVEIMEPRRKGTLRKIIKRKPIETGHFGHPKLRWRRIGHDDLMMMMMMR